MPSGARIPVYLDCGVPTAARPGPTKGGRHEAPSITSGDRSAHEEDDGQMWRQPRRRTSARQPEKPTAAHLASMDAYARLIVGG